MLKRFTPILGAVCLSVIFITDGLWAQQRVTVAYSAITPIMAGVWMAKEIGAFEKNDLRAELVYISSGAITVQAMVGGDLTMTVAASNAVISAVLRGAPLLAVGSVMNRPAMSLWVQPEITKPDQLQGKVLGITRYGSSTHFLTLAALERLGLAGKVKLQPFGGTVEADTAFRAKMIAGRITAVRPSPQAHSLVDLAKLNIPFSMDLIAVKKDFYHSFPKTVEGMLKAYIEGVAALRKKEQAYEVLEKYLRRRSADLQEPYEYAVKYLDPVPKVDPAVVQTVLDWEGRSDVPVSGFFDNAIVDRLVQEGFIERQYKGGR
jgi:ABC-type nitrate/sulfonate/bicarbonate transport system substrate-binding protein